MRQHELTGSFICHSHQSSSPVPVQGYGLTETCAASFLALPHGGMSGTVGPPVSSLELRLEGNSELG